MKTLVKILCLCSFLFSLSDESMDLFFNNITTEVISEYENGNIKEQIRYRGIKLNEFIIERKVFFI